MRTMTAAALVAALVFMPVLASAAQRVLPNADEAQAWRDVAAAIPPGTKIKLQTTAGRRLTVTLMSVDSSGITVKKNTRVPEPAIALPYAEIAYLQRAGDNGGVGVGKAIGIGLAAGAGAILTLFMIALSFDD